ncbi:MAG: diguanylate cyclase [Candidatus Eisenbacteria sp.]|nr:diguanylate cyclase [Candidatus Eisenbacteria bacterium]
MERSGFFRAMIDNLHDGVYFVDRDRRIVYWSKSAEELTGYASNEVIGRTCDDEMLMHVDEEGKNLCRDMCPITETLEDGELREAELFLHHKSGHRVPVAIRVAPVRDRKGDITGAVELFSENSALLSARVRIDELEKVATLDPLTRLPSRRCLEQELTSKVDELARFGRTFGVVSIRVDRMEKLNGAFGRDVGDDVLRMVGNTLLYNCRPFDVIGRWGGAEFMGTVVGVERDGLIKVAERLRAMIGKSMLPVEDRTVSVTVSVGGVMAEWGDTTDALIDRAEQMMHRSRGRGRDRVTVWE